MKVEGKGADKGVQEEEDIEEVGVGKQGGKDVNEVKEVKEEVKSSASSNSLNRGRKLPPIRGDQLKGSTNEIISDKKSTLEVSSPLYTTQNAPTVNENHPETTT